MHLLDAPEIEMELESPPLDCLSGSLALIDMRAKIRDAGLACLDTIGYGGVGSLKVVGPPDKVLRLIPGLWERYDQERQQARQAEMMRNVANDAWERRKKMDAIRQFDLQQAAMTGLNWRTQQHGFPGPIGTTFVNSIGAGIGSLFGGGLGP